MKTLSRTILLLLALGLQFFSFGCAHTVKGVSQDYHAAEDKVEGALK